MIDTDGRGYTIRPGAGTLDVDRLHLAPCLPAAWSGFSLSYRYRETYYDIAVRRVEVDSQERPGTTVDGAIQPANVVHLAEDGLRHHVEVRATPC